MLLTKSKYISGIQCLKYLWFLINAPDSVPPYDDTAKFYFQQGEEVGELAKRLYPEGIDIKHGKDIKEELKLAQKLTGLCKNNNGDNLINDFAKKSDKNLSTVRLPLFEPAFSYKNSFARADILVPVKTNAWDIIEVKSALSIKEINIHDLAFQKYCYEGAGLVINDCYLLYINKNFIKETQIIEPHKFFIMENVNNQVDHLLPDVENNINIMLEAINESRHPKIEINKNCSSPYDCPLKNMCWGFLPDGNVFEFYRGKNLAFSLFDKGIMEISKIQDTNILNPIQKIQYQALSEKKIIVDKANIRLFLNKLRYPLYFLDFETFSTAIPKYIGTRPFQNIPFQFSCNKIQSIQDMKQEDFYFLADDANEDPREKFLRSLKRALGYISENAGTKDDGNEYPKGSILVFYESFEKNILRELALMFPKESNWIQDAISRIIDMYEPFGKFYYYNPSQKGSASLKRVLPAVTGVDYNNLDISNGQEASLKFLEMVFAQNKEDAIKQKQSDDIRKALLDYCAMDTQGLIFILKELYKLVER